MTFFVQYGRNIIWDELNTLTSSLVCVGNMFSSFNLHFFLKSYNYDQLYIKLTLSFMSKLLCNHKILLKTILLSLLYNFPPFVRVKSTSLYNVRHSILYPNWLEDNICNYNCRRYLKRILNTHIIKHRFPNPWFQIFHHYK